MKTSILKKSETLPKQPGTGNGENYWAEAVRISELRYRRLFETAQDGILILDATSGEIMDVNPFLIDLLDYSFEELCGRKLWEIGLFKDVAANQLAFKTLQQNEYIRYENLPLRRKDGKQIQVEFVSNAYWVETDKVIQCNIRDITARSETELELANSTRNARLIAHSQSMRIPMMAITSMLGLMELGHNLAEIRPLHEKPSEFDETAFQHVRRNILRLVRYFNELADLTGQDRLQVESSRPPAIATSIVASLESENNRL